MKKSFSLPNVVNTTEATTDIVDDLADVTDAPSNATDSPDDTIDDTPEPIFVPPLRQPTRPREWYMPCMWTQSWDINGNFRAVSNVTQEVFEGNPKDFARMLRNE